MQPHLKPHDRGPKGRAGLLLTLLFDALARITLTSDACQRLRDDPSDEAARLALRATLPNCAATQRQLNRSLAGHLPKVLRKDRQRLALDLVLIPYRATSWINRHTPISWGPGADSILKHPRLFSKRHRAMAKYVLISPKARAKWEIALLLTGMTYPRLRGGILLSFIGVTQLVDLCI
ncbi:MAG: hypothetical protein JO329_10105 [Planctomycetaceae bacterium]|nr:hypothetical protein [Planctomycetaceae bacterium]